MVSLVHGLVIVATLATVGCGSSPPPPANPPPQPMQQQQQQQASGPVNVTTNVYVTPGRSAERSAVAMLDDGPIAESPLVVDAEERRELHEAKLAAMAPPVVVVRDSAPAPYYVPTPSSVVIVRDLPRSQRAHTKWFYDRAAKRCEGRATRWSQNRCLRGVASR